MDLILWRHAEAVELPLGQTDYELDLARELTSRGQKQATRMASWLDRQLPEHIKIAVSPASRCQATALALGRKYKTNHNMGPSGSPADLLENSGWPDAKTPLLIIGHQPALGQLAGQLLGLQAGDCSIRKGAVWWLRSRMREGLMQTNLVAVQSPEFL